MVQFDLEGWLCPALFKYFPEAPGEIHVKAGPRNGWQAGAACVRLSLFRCRGCILVCADLAGVDRSQIQLRVERRHVWLQGRRVPPEPRDSGGPPLQVLAMEIAASGLVAATPSCKPALARVRPRLMMPSKTAFGLMPIFGATGRGSDVMQPMAIPSVGGMTVNLLVAILIAACLLCAVEKRDWKHRAAASVSANSP